VIPFLTRAVAGLSLRTLHRLGTLIGWLGYLLSPTYRRRLDAHAALAGLTAAERREAIASAGRMVAELPFLWLRPADLSGLVMQQRLTPIYVPMWLVDAEVTGTWAAQAGYAYDVASTHENFQSGQWLTQRVTETRLRWEPRAGQVQRAYANVTAPALEDHARLTERLGAFPLEAAQPYDPAAAQAAAR
jgi:hypothetical protein